MISNAINFCNNSYRKYEHDILAFSKAYHFAIFSNCNKQLSSTVKLILKVNKLKAEYCFNNRGQII